MHHPLSAQDVARVDAIWGAFAEGQVSGECFLDIEYVIEVYQKRPYPKGQEFLDAARQQHGRPFERVLILGCGDGALERAMVHRGYARETLGLDISARAIAHARAAAERAGYATMRYDQTDLNQPPGGLGTFDAVFYPSSLHHVAELERVLDWTRERLAPGGLLALSEYVGPTRFQWSDRQKQEAQAVLALIPPHFRRLPGGGTKDVIWAPTATEVATADPSEAVRSGEILDAVAQRFRILRREDLGGGLLFPVLQHIARNFHHEDYHALVLMQFLLHLDDLLLRTGVLPSHCTDLLAV